MNFLKDLDFRCTRIAELLQSDASLTFHSFRPLLLQGGFDEEKLDRWIAVSLVPYRISKS
jgi:hypothetical protein